MIFTTDDLAPVHMDYFKEHIDPLAKQYPNFRIIAFTTPLWHDSPQESILETGFVEFAKARTWLIIAMHGKNHLTYECIADRARQRNMFQFGQDCLAELNKKGVRTLNAFKPPFYRWNFDSLEIASQEGFRYYFTQDGILDLRSFMFHGRSKIGLLDSHTNPKEGVNMKDRINLKPFDNALKNCFDPEEI